jgi:hypothetical protein
MVIGLKSLGQTAPTFFGRSTISVLFKLASPRQSPMVNAYTAAMTSSRMVGHADL